MFGYINTFLSSINVLFINDLNEEWPGKLKIYIENDSGIVTMNKQDITLTVIDRSIFNYNLMIPEESGEYRILAEVEVRGEGVRSIRKFEVDNTSTPSSN